MITDATVTNGIPTATGNNPVVISETIIQDAMKKYYRKISNYKTYSDIVNLVSSTIIGTVTLTMDVTDKKLILVKSDDTHIITDVITSDLVTTNVDDATKFDVDISSFENIEAIAYIITKAEHFVNDTELQLLVEKIYINTTHNYSLIRYEDLTIYPAMSLTTKVNMSLGSTIKEISYDVLEIDYELGNAIHTSNILPLNNVTATGITTTDDAYKPFDGTNGIAFSEAVPSDGVIDIEHIYEFDTPTTCYAIKFMTALKEQAPRSMTVSGSVDGTTYVELLVNDIEVGVDNVTFNRYFDISLCTDYKYYKIALTKGTPDGTVSINKYELVKELTV